MSNHVKIKKRLSVIRYPLNNGRNLLLFPLFILILLFAACGGGSSSGGSDPDKVVKPIATPAGGTYTAAQSVTLSTTTDGADIYYTLNDSTPTDSSTLYSSAITISATSTLKAIAIKDGMTDSDILTATYTIKFIAAEWRKTLSDNGEYEADGTDTKHTGLTTVIGENKVTLSGGDLGSDVVISNIYTEGGGQGTKLTPSEWAYVYKDGAKIGFIVKYNLYGTTCYDILLGAQAKARVAGYDFDLGITIDLTGVPDYPSVFADHGFY